MVGRMFTGVHEVAGSTVVVSSFHAPGAPVQVSRIWFCTRVMVSDGGWLGSSTNTASPG